MAKSTTTRLGLQRWTADTDSQDRTEFDGAHAQLEALAAGFIRDVIENRPAAAAAYEGFWFEATDESGALYWCTGSAWLGPFALVSDLDAAEVTFDPTGLTELTATDVQGALVEVDTALASGSSLVNDPLWDAAGDLVYGTGADAAARLAAGDDGDVLTLASGLPSWAAPAAGGGATVVIKPADESISSSTTLQDDDDLTFAVGANEDWQFVFYVFALGDTAGDIKLGVSGPAGATIRVAPFGPTDSASNFSSFQMKMEQGNEFTAPTFATSTAGVYFVIGTIENGATAGAITLQWAQGASSGTATTVRQGSSLIANKVA